MPEVWGPPFETHCPKPMPPLDKPKLRPMLPQVPLLNGGRMGARTLVQCWLHSQRQDSKKKEAHLSVGHCPPTPLLPAVQAPAAALLEDRARLGWDTPRLLFLPWRSSLPLALERPFSSPELLIFTTQHSFPLGPSLLPQDPLPLSVLTVVGSAPPKQQSTRDSAVSRHFSHE